ncbi:MAG: helix-turn-helix transcriptional regulator [Flavobacteriaceae bacterium]|nr:helix-turn-helix transcriptional regulator [Flavobacteriaceae bacterium]
MNLKKEHSLRLIIGHFVKRNRIKKRLTQQQLVDRLKVDRQYVWKIENGKINLTTDYIEKIITSLKCTKKDFFDHFK